jgi:hypothetical protein
MADHGLTLNSSANRPMTRGPPPRNLCSSKREAAMSSPSSDHSVRLLEGPRALECRSATDARHQRGTVGAETIECRKKRQSCC